MNNTDKYLILASTIGVWIYLGIKIISNLNTSSVANNSVKINTKFNPKISTAIDTFSIQPLERDPFLGKITSNKKTINAVSSTKKSEAIYISILYHGVIAKENSSDKLYIITIENQQHFIKVGQLINDIKLLNATNKEIKVKYKGVVKTIKKV